MSDQTSPDEPCVIQLCSDGPILIEGNAERDGSPLEQGTALCRCGRSANKPYCDGSHKTAGFRDDGALDPAGITGTAEAGSTLKLKFAPNGPILCAGAMTLRSSDGSVTASGARAALCRCGASGRKPFCDGTHARIGFDDGQNR